MVNFYLKERKGNYTYHGRRETHRGAAGTLRCVCVSLCLFGAHTCVYVCVCVLCNLVYKSPEMSVEKGLMLHG